MSSPADMPGAPVRLCYREGCEQPITRYIEQSGHRFCTYMCRYIVAEFEKAERLCRRASGDPMAAELWASVVALSDTMTSIKALSDELYALHPPVLN